MRSIFFAMAVAAIATISTGCTMSCKFSGPCRTLSNSCSVDQGGPSCTSCSSSNCGGDCGSTTCNVVQPLGQNLTMNGGCDDGCPDGLLGGSGAFGGGNVGMGLFQKGALCSSGGGCGDTGCDGGCGGEIVDSGMGMDQGIGCGKFGCGMGGRLCLGCKWRGRRGAGFGGGAGIGGAGLGSGLAGGLQNFHNSFHPYGGQVPHTPAPSYGGMAGGGGGTPSYAYPYYTTRGPRDFLNGNPPSIGR